MKPTSKPLKVNNTRDDKLLTSFWKDSFEKRRCLIPVTAWAEAEGEKGKMTKTWYSLPDAELFAVAGIWRSTVEWGDAYSMVMVDGCQQMSDVHDRMPVILRPDAWQQWTQGTPDEALSLVRTCDDTLIVDRTTVPWVKPGKAEGNGSTADFTLPAIITFRFHHRPKLRPVRESRRVEPSGRGKCYW
jgi:putative SOS response-associated peptidase YedK